MSDIAIVGGGIIGMLSARALQDQGAIVSLFDRQAVGQECSWAGGGILSPLYPWRYPAALNRLAHASQIEYPMLCTELGEVTGIDPEWTVNGLMILNTQEYQQARLWAEQTGTRMESLTDRQITELEPFLNPNQTSALWFPDIAQVRTPRLLKALRADLARRGIRLHEHEPVEQIVIQQNEVTGLITKRGKYPASRLIIAAGAWSTHLLPTPDPSLTITPVRGQMILIKAGPGTVQQILLAGDHYLIPRRDGRILAGSTLEQAGFDKTVTDAARTELTSFAHSIIPALKQYPVEHQWAGLRPTLADDVPVIGRHPDIAGLFINSGHYRNGVVTAPASARLLCTLILGTKPNIDPEPYTLAIVKPY